MMKFHFTIEADTAEELADGIGYFAGRIQAPGVYATVSTIEVKPGSNLYSPYPDKVNPPADMTVTAPGYIPPAAPAETPQPAPQPVQEALQPVSQPTTPPPQPVQPAAPQGPAKEDVMKAAAAWMRSEDTPNRMKWLQSVMDSNGVASMADITDAQLPAVLTALREKGVAI